LAAATTDEDQPVPKSSPEKRSLLSPSVSSISEIFAKSASAKLAATSKKEDKTGTVFSGRKAAAAELPDQRKSVFVAEENCGETPVKTSPPGKHISSSTALNNFYSKKCADTSSERSMLFSPKKANLSILTQNTILYDQIK
jgi:hypothetical protein